MIRITTIPYSKTKTKLLKVVIRAKIITKDKKARMLKIWEIP